jgi:hypothetical protein
MPAARPARLTKRAGNWDVYVMNTDGSRKRKLTCSPLHERRFVWSPRRKR